jgi:GR25 family glycosyltransferase involved in LPS biosynthesis
MSGIRIMNPFSYFCKIYVINLDSRPDRMRECQNEFNKLGIETERFPGIVFTGTQDDYWNRCMGCHLSHLSIIKKAKELNLKNILIFEDDVKFINNPVEILSNALIQLPCEWDMFYLGGNICRKMTKISENIAKLSHAQSTHAYAINGNFYDIILNKMNEFNTRHMDVVYADDLVPNFNCYISIPMIAVQKNGYSNIEGKNVNYESWMETRFWKQLWEKLL